MNDPRFNPWPLGVALVYGSFATIMIGFVVWSASHKVDLVAPDYYAKEIDYQQEIDALERSFPYTDQVAWDRLGGGLEIVVADPLRTALTNGVLRFYRPSDSALDHNLPLDLDPKGRFVLDITALAKGFWRARIEWRRDGKDYALETSLFL